VYQQNDPIQTEPTALGDRTGGRSQKLIPKPPERRFVFVSLTEKCLGQSIDALDSVGSGVGDLSFDSIRQGVGHSLTKRFVCLRLNGDQVFAFRVSRVYKQVCISRLAREFVKR
jgi:hypothetical protein